MRFCLLAVALCALSLPIASLAQQAGSPPGEAAPSQFAQEPIVLRDAKSVVQFNADGTGMRTESQAFTVQSEAAVRNFGVVGVTYASASQTAEFVYVRVRLPDGSVIDTPLTDVQDQTPPVTQQAPFYSDLKQKQVPVRGLQVGDTVEWQTRVTVTKAEAPNQFWGAMPFVRGLVTLNQSIELRLPTRTAVNVWTNPADHVSPQRTTEGEETVYRWQWRSVEPTVGKEAEAAKKAKEGKLLTADETLDAAQGRLPDVAFTTFPDWASVGAWYRGLEGDRMQPDAAVRARVAQITAHSETEQDKVRAVYDWVASNIRYVGVALGVGRYQPHAASEVLQNQYGDCKDKHTLLASMLLALGEQPDAVLIGAGVRFNAAVPSPAAFNHLITHLTLDGTPVWLDSTSEVAAFQVLVPPLRNKDALVVPLAAPAKVERTPAGYPFAPFSTLAVKTTVDKDLSSDSVIVYRFHDDSEVLLRSLLRQASPAQYPEFVQKLMAGLGFGGTTSDPVIDNLHDQEKPLTMLFHYHRVHDADWGDNRVTAIFGPTEVPAIDEKQPPVSSIHLGLPRVEESVTDVRLPDGWSAELPEAVHQQLPQVRIDTTYRLDGRTLHAERRTTILSDEVPAADWKQYQKWYVAAGAGSVPYLQLVPPGNQRANGAGQAGTSAAAQAAGGPAPPKAKTQAERLAEAARLVGSGADKLRQNDVDAAEKDLNEAKALNENQEFLSGNLGVVAARRGNSAEAMRLYRKEVELYPRSDFAWRNLIGLQIAADPKTAAGTARDWVAASPDKLEPRATLVRVLWASGDNAAALTAAREGTAALPGDVREGNDYQLLLGEAQVRGGDNAGVETLSHLIQADATTLQSNDADYELAKAHRQLPLAERTQRDVLKKLGAETLSWTGDESAATMRNASTLLSAAWDTMGWILYQEGKFAEAETYIGPAWRNRPNAEIGEHLGDVQMALHKNLEANRHYVLAELVSRGAPDTSATLHAKVNAARQKRPVDFGGKDPAQFLAAERTFPLAGATDLSGTALYDILFTRDHVLRVKPLPGSTTPAQDAKVREAKLAALFPPDQAAALFHAVSLVCKGGACSVQLDQ
ncbi:DUF3857 domain-containing protein [Terriglobus sp.]|uniref:DUF3857 domain-containing protein n=1 Tax=Terriglobus sp. TaxID=1889013 RepID=UPI003B0088D1